MSFFKNLFGNKESSKGGVPERESTEADLAKSPSTKPLAHSTSSSPPTPPKPKRKGKYSNPKIEEDLDWAISDGSGRFILSRMSPEDLRQIYDQEEVSNIRELHIDGTYFNDAGNTAGNRFGEAGAVTLANCLGKSPGVEKLFLQGNEIGDKGLEALAIGLASLHSLKELQLAENRIGDVGLQALAKSFGSLTSLTSLNLSKNDFGNAGVQALAQCLGTLTSIKTLNLYNIQFGDEGAKAFATGLFGLTSLHELDLKSCQIGDAGALALADSLSKLPSLHTNLCYNEIGDDGLEALRRCKGHVSMDKGNRPGWSQDKIRFETQKTKLADALKHANFQAAEEIFATPGSPTVTDALFMACGFPGVEIKTFEWLFDKGAKINSRGPIERTPLHELIMRSKDESTPGMPNPHDKMKVMIARGADLTAKEEHGLTPEAMAKYLGKHQTVALLSNTSPRLAWEQIHPIEASFEAMSRDLVRDHGPLIRVEYLSHWPKFEINFYYRDGACIHSGARTGHYDIHFLSLGYNGEGPRYAKHFLKAAGFNLTADEISGIKVGDSIALVDEKAEV